MKKIKNNHKIILIAETMKKNINIVNAVLKLNPSHLQNSKF